GKTLLIVGIAIVALIVVVVLVVVLVMRGKSTTDPSSQQSSSPSPTVTDNGVSALTAQEILTRSEAAALAQSSVHIVAEGTNTTGPITMDVILTKSAGASGSMTSDGATFSFVERDSTIWMKGDAAFWTKAGAKPAAIAAIGTKWVKMPSTNPAGSSAAALGNYTDMVHSFYKTKGAVTKGETADLNGQKTIVIIDPEDNGKLWVAATGEPLPLQTQRLATTANPTTANGTFSQWGTATVATAPADTETVDVATLPLT
ncbi:MAG: hypothetical protein WCP28_17760, partial [Actinomycetes bacterium]